MPTEKCTFENKDGHKLSGLIEMPEEGEPQAFGIFAHCFTCNKNYKGIRNISRTLSAAGIAMLAVDFAGLGESEGDFSETTLSSNVSDLLAAADYLERNYQAPRLLIGHSMGGAAVLCAAQNIRSARAVVTIGAPAEPTHLRKHFPKQFEKIEREGQAEVSIGGVKFLLKKQFLEDLEATSMEKLVGGLDRPLMIVHSTADATVDMENAERIFAMAKAPKSVVLLDNADHLLSAERDSRFVGTIIAAWAERYLHRSVKRENN